MQIHTCVWIHRNLKILEKLQQVASKMSLMSRCDCWVTWNGLWTRLVGHYCLIYLNNLLSSVPFVIHTHLFIHIKHLYSVSSIKLFRGAPDSSTAKKSSLKGEKSTHTFMSTYTHTYIGLHTHIHTYYTHIRTHNQLWQIRLRADIPVPTCT